MSRPEHQAPPEIVYNDDEAQKYATNSRMIRIQTKMAERAMELLQLPENKPCHILDIGCGSGLSGEVLSEAGHSWIGVDISPSMLGVAKSREVEGDLLCCDIGQGLFFRTGTFDGCISVSVLQWLCNADRKEHVPQVRLKKFFSSLIACLKKGARAVFQFYPESADQLNMITKAALTAGFNGGVVTDYPNSSKAKKMFLTLVAGEPDFVAPAGKTGDEDDEDAQPEERKTILFAKPSQDPKARRERRKAKGRDRGDVKSQREWTLQKKERMRKQGKKVTEGSEKYTARKRKPKF